MWVSAADTARPGEQVPWLRAALSATPPSLHAHRPRRGIRTGRHHQGDALVAGRWDTALIWKVLLTYLVPFVVATWGALINSRVT